MRTLRSLPFLLLTACTLSIQVQNGWAELSWLGTEPVSEQKTMTVECPPTATTLRAVLRAAGTAGELTLVLVDPDGVERHHQNVQPGRCEIVQHWPVRGGAWKLHLTATGFAGSYALSLTTGDTPIKVALRVVDDRPR